MAALLLLALALATDAFAVSLVRGANGEHSSLRALECGVAFGLAQGLMPLVGWGLGELFSDRIAAVDHWVAFGLLVLLGAKMIHAAFTPDRDEPSEAPGRGSHVAGLFAAALATSVDAAAAGLALELFASAVWLSCLAIGLVTFLLCTIGYWFASRIGTRLGHYAEGAGGLVLIMLGAGILAQHLA